MIVIIFRRRRRPLVIRSPRDVYSLAAAVHPSRDDNTVRYTVYTRTHIIITIETTCAKTDRFLPNFGDIKETDYGAPCTLRRVFATAAAAAAALRGRDTDRQNRCG